MYLSSIQFMYLNPFNYIQVFTYVSFTIYWLIWLIKPYFRVIFNHLKSNPKSVPVGSLLHWGNIAGERKYRKNNAWHWSNTGLCYTGLHHIAQHHNFSLFLSVACTTRPLWLTISSAAKITANIFTCNSVRRKRNPICSNPLI